PIWSQAAQFGATAVRGIRQLAASSESKPWIAPPLPHNEMLVKTLLSFELWINNPISQSNDCSESESVRKHQAGLQSFRSMRRIEASRRNASALRLRFSQSFASLRQRLSQAKVRSTTQRRGSTTNPFVRSERLTISVSSCGKIFAKAF